MSTDALTLDQLYDRCLQGDVRAEADLFQQLNVRFLSIAKRRIQKDHAEDVVQDTLKIVFDKYRQKQPEAGILVWSLTVLRNVIGNFYQAKEREGNRLDFVEELPADAACHENPLAEAELAQLRDNLLAAVGELAQRFPRCGVLFHGLLQSCDEGGSPNQVSTRALEIIQKEQPQLTRGSFYTALHRCRGYLKEFLARREEGSSHV
jgi:DNA-directed RNA polymerase specialized sigma24 family protein